MVERYRHRNKYKLWYEQLMARAKIRRPLSRKYYENHHVVPKALGGSNEKVNIVKLTYREHFLAHWLLTKFTAGSDLHKMLYAFCRMAQRSASRGVLDWQYDTTRFAKERPEYRLGLSELQKAGNRKSVKATESRRSVPKRNKLSLIAKAQWADPEKRERIQTALKLSAERRFADPEYTAKHSARVSAELEIRYTDPIQLDKLARAREKAHEVNRSSEGRAASSARMFANHANSEFEEVRVAKLKLWHADPVNSQANSSRMKALWADPVWRANLLAKRQTLIDAKNADGE
jgi:hypothetical protein